MSGHLLFNVRREKWHLAAMLGEDNIDELWLGEVSCTVQYEPTRNTLIAILNRKPGNGDFARMMDFLEGEADADHKQFKVAEIWNKGLLEHLVTKRKYRASDDGAIKC